MSKPDWITEEQFQKAREIGKQHFDEFCLSDHEQELFYIEIDGVHFVLDCFDENLDNPRTDVYCNIHATYLEKNDDGYLVVRRAEDGNKFTRLLTHKKYNWITDYQLDKATDIAINSFNHFWLAEDLGEEYWVGVEIEGKEFDINCSDVSGAEDGNYRDNTTGFGTCDIYPTKEVDGQTQVDTDNSITLLARIYGTTYKLQEIKDVD